LSENRHKNPNIPFFKLSGQVDHSQEYVGLIPSQELTRLPTTYEYWSMPNNWLLLCLRHNTTQKLLAIQKKRTKPLVGRFSQVES